MGEENEGLYFCHCRPSQKDSAEQVEENGPRVDRVDGCCEGCDGYACRREGVVGPSVVDEGERRGDREVGA